MTSASSPPSTSLPSRPVWVGAFLIPFLMVAGASLIIFGLSRLMLEERGVDQLLDELESKTFGNKWMAAYELAKKLSQKSLLQREYEELTLRLPSLYQHIPEKRTREFLVVAMGKMQETQFLPQLLPTLEEAMKDEDPKIQFAGLVALTKTFQDSSRSIPPRLLAAFEELLDRGIDEGSTQVLILFLGQHWTPSSIPENIHRRLVGFLESSSPNLKYAAATVLIRYHEKKALDVLLDLLRLKEGSSFNEQQREQLKMNALRALQLHPWKEESLLKELQDMYVSEKNLVVSTKVKELLNDFR